MKNTNNGGANQYRASSQPLGESKKAQLESLGLTTQRASEYEKMSEHPEIVQHIIENNEDVTKAAVLKAIKTANKKKQVNEAMEAIKQESEGDQSQAIITIGNGIGFAPTHKYDLLLTDPPYSTDVDDIDSFVDSWLYNALDGVTDNGFAYIFIGAYPKELQAYLSAQAPPHINLEQVLIWTYKNTLGNNPKDRYKLNYQACLFYRGINAPPLNCPLTSEQWAVQEINAPDGRLGNRFHTWQKPIEIAERFIRHSTQKEQTVFDPFACTGTFLLAAAKLGRKAYGFEINPDNAKIAEERGCVISTR